MAKPVGATLGNIALYWLELELILYIHGDNVFYNTG